MDVIFSLRSCKKNWKNRTLAFDYLWTGELGHSLSKMKIWDLTYIKVSRIRKEKIAKSESFSKPFSGADVYHVISLNKRLSSNWFLNYKLWWRGEVMTSLRAFWRLHFFFWRIKLYMHVPCKFVPFFLGNIPLSSS